jgi:hypothetical protein
MGVEEAPLPTYLGRGLLTHAGDVSKNQKTEKQQNEENTPAGRLHHRFGVHFEGARPRSTAEHSTSQQSLRPNHLSISLFLVFTSGRLLPATPAPLPLRRGEASDLRAGDCVNSQHKKERNTNKPNKDTGQSEYTQRQP